MSQSEISDLMDAAAAGSRDAVHKRIAAILMPIAPPAKRGKLAELNAELSSETVEMFRLSDKAIVASVIRQARTNLQRVA